MFPQGAPQTKPEIYAMGFRNPFTVQADPSDPGTVVVGEYGPDAATDSATFGPAGVIEWDHISEPGFFGWPLCVGDNAAARSYFRYDFSSGSQGARYDCSAAAIPNDSEFNTGLDEIPGPAVEADVWAKNGGGTPPRFGIPGVANEAATGPIYDYDPQNPSQTKWPAYYDGAWLIFNRAANWWREVRPLDDRSGILRVNGFLPTNQFGAPPHNFVIPTRFGPDGSLYLVTWSGGCCRSGLPAIGEGTLMRIDFSGEGEDTTPPQVEAEVSGTQQGGAYVGRATLTLTATDASGVDTIESRVNGGEWTAYEEPVEFTELGSYDVDYRATDLAPIPNTSEPQTISFEVIEGTGCLPVRSDEFDGTSLDTARWSFFHPTTPTSGAGAPTVSGGALNLPLGAFSIDQARPGPIGFVGQPLPDGDFTVTTEVSAPGLDADETGQGSLFAQVGLHLYQTDDDWVKVAHTRNAAAPGSVDTYLEITYETAGTRTLGDRSTPVPPPAPTAWFRLTRTGDQLFADYTLADPDQGGTWTPLTFNQGSVTSVNLATVFDPADGPVYIGPYGGNGSVTAGYDYVRFTPDEARDCDPPTTTAQLNGADPEPSYDGPVEVTLSATDGAGGSGVASTEYALDGGAFQEYTGPFTVSGVGPHEVEFFSTDEAGNVEETQSVSFEIEEGGGEPDLRLAVTPGRDRVRVGQTAAFTATVRNTGDGPAASLRVCVRAPKSKLRVVGKECVRSGALDPGERMTPRFRLKPQRSARGKSVNVTFTATAAGLGTERDRTTVSVRRR
jgi:hypothetical protein